MKNFKIHPIFLITGGVIVVAMLVSLVGLIKGESGAVLPPQPQVQVPTYEDYFTIDRNSKYTVSSGTAKKDSQREDYWLLQFSNNGGYLTFRIDQRVAYFSCGKPVPSYEIKEGEFYKTAVDIDVPFIDAIDARAGCP